MEVIYSLFVGGIAAFLGNVLGLYLGMGIHKLLGTFKKFDTESNHTHSAILFLMANFFGIIGSFVYLVFITSNTLFDAGTNVTLALFVVQLAIVLGLPIVNPN